MVLFPGKRIFYSSTAKLVKLTSNDWKIHATRWFKAANFNQSEPMVRTVGDHGGHNGTADATAQEEGRAKVVRRSGNVQPLGAPAFLIVSLVVLLSAPVMAGSTADMDAHQTSTVNSLTMMALLLAGWSTSTVRVPSSSYSDEVTANS